MTDNRMMIDPIEARLDKYAGDITVRKPFNIGYPVNLQSRLIGFYKWFIGSGLNLTMANNVGDPFDLVNKHFSANSHEFEREVIKKMSSLYGFDDNDYWGLITFSGTDGNNHGIYFGTNYLKKKTGKKPVVYVSDSAHYSSRRLADLQGLELKLIPSDVHGCMVPEELEKAIVPDKPALVVYAVGTTFKGGIDDMKTLNTVLAKFPDLVVYRHIDGALFGGYLPYTEHSDLLNRKINPFDSIAVSGHKFFGMDEPAGFFITTKEVRDEQTPNNISYLNCDMPMINCSRSALTPLKLWWILEHTSKEEFIQQTRAMLDTANWFKEQLDKLGWPAWLEPLSNTVYFKQPSKQIMDKYELAPDFDERLGGDLAHIVVMQHVTRDRLQVFLDDLK